MDEVIGRSRARLAALLLAGALLASCFICPPVRARYAELDPSFGTGGILAIPDAGVGCGVGGYVGALEALAGDRLLAGLGSSLVRVEADGKLDPGFASQRGGGCPAPRPGGGSIGGLAPGPGGGILVAGSYGITVLEPDGAPGNYFPEGIRYLGAEPLVGAATQPDGRIVVAGTIRGVNASPVFARLTTTGRSDRTFGVRGVTVVRSPFNRGAELDDMALQPHGGVVGVGMAQNKRGGYRIYIVRLRADGIRDRRFGSSHNGVVTVAGGGYAFGVSVLVRGNGRILVMGSNEGVRSASRVILVQLLPNGRRDPGFGHRGVMRARVFDAQPTDMALEGGKIVVVGWAGARCPGDAPACFLLARYRGDGRPDRSFGRQGLLRTSLGSEAFGETVALTSEGQIVVGGRANPAGRREAVLARYLP